MKKIALITGASSGIGRDFARIIDKKEALIDEIWLIGRNRDRLYNTSNMLNHKTKILALDISFSNNLTYLSRLFKNEDVEIEILVNAAGFGIDGDFITHSYAKIKSLLRLNMEALTIITYDALKYMDYGARIINIASSAAFLPQPKFAIYAASKSYVLSFTRALREELKEKKINVTAVCPGPVETRFFDELKDFGKKLEMIKLAKSIDVALYGYKDNLRNKSVSVYGNQIKAFRILCKFIPKDLILKVYSRIINVSSNRAKRG